MSSRALALLLLLGGAAHADPVLLRMAGVAPEGTMWAREVKALERDVDAVTQGRVRMKWYLGGIAGDELTVVDRIRRGQLDGEAGGGFCERLAPSMRVLRLVGLMETRDEERYVLSHMRSRIETEMAKSGFVSLGFASFGALILMTRTPVASLEELRRAHLWMWNEDDVAARGFERLGVRVVIGDPYTAAGQYTDGRVDGFVAMPLAGLAFQWSAQARWFTELPIGLLPGCMVIAHRAFDALPIADQMAIRGAAAKMLAHFEETGRVQDEALLGGLFERQGMKRAVVSPVFRDQFYGEVRRDRDAVAREVASPELLDQVLTWLADYRAEHTRTKP